MPCAMIDADGAAAFEIRLVQADRLGRTLQYTKNYVNSEKCTPNNTRRSPLNLVLCDIQYVK